MLAYRRVTSDLPERPPLADPPRVPADPWWLRVLAWLEPHERIAIVFALGTWLLFVAFGFRSSWRWVGLAYGNYLIFVSKAVLGLWLPLWLYRRWRGRTTWREAGVELTTYLRGALVLLLVTIAYTHLKARKLDLNPRLFDDWLLRADDWLLAGGRDFVAWVARHTHDRTWTVWMERLYLQSGLALAIPLGLAFGWRGREVVRRAFAALVLCYALGGLLYVALPALGPAFVRRDSYAHLDWTLTWFQQTDMLQGLKAMVLGRDVPVVPFKAIAAFPSLHVGIAWLGFLIAWTYVRPAAFLVAPFVALIGVSAVWFGWHYVVDFPPGILLAWFCWWAAGTMVVPPPPEARTDELSGAQVG